MAVHYAISERSINCNTARSREETGNYSTGLGKRKPNFVTPGRVSDFKIIDSICKYVARKDKNTF